MRLHRDDEAREVARRADRMEERSSDRCRQIAVSSLTFFPPRPEASSIGLL